MSNNSTCQLPKFFRIVAIAAIVWNLLGVASYVMEATMSEEAMAALPESQQVLYTARPAWVAGVFAIAVFAGLAGSIMLKLRNNLAIPIYTVSLVAVIVQMFYMFAMSDTLAVMGASSAALPSMVLIIAAALVWFSTRAKANSWIN